jgi:hypothetical protein
MNLQVMLLRTAVVPVAVRQACWNEDHVTGAGLVDVVAELHGRVSRQEDIELITGVQMQ